MRRWAPVLLLALAACAAAAPGPAPRGLTLDAGGIQPSGTPLRVDFGRAQAGTIAAVSDLLGRPPAQVVTNPECGAGPVTSAVWPGAVTLNFRDGSFLGWVSEGTATSAGLAPGTPRSALAGATFAVTSLGEEFAAGGVFGLLEGDRVAVVWSGVTCFIR